VGGHGEAEPEDGTAADLTDEPVDEAVVEAGDGDELCADAVDEPELLDA
jgi:hypothetical protein